MGGRGRRQGLGIAALPPPTIYRAKGEGEGAALPLPPRKGAARGESFPPKAPRRCLPPCWIKKEETSLHRTCVERGGAVRSALGHR